MPVYYFLKDIVKLDMTRVLACKVFNEVKNLNFIIDRECEIKTLDSTTSDGNRIYVRASCQGRI